MHSDTASNIQHSTSNKHLTMQGKKKCAISLMPYARRATFYFSDAT